MATPLLTPGSGRAPQVRPPSAGGRPAVNPQGPSRSGAQPVPGNGPGSRLKPGDWLRSSRGQPGPAGSFSPRRVWMLMAAIFAAIVLLIVILGATRGGGSTVAHQPAVTKPGVPATKAKGSPAKSGTNQHQSSGPSSSGSSPVGDTGQAVSGASPLLASAPTGGIVGASGLSVSYPGQKLTAPTPTAPAMAGSVVWQICKGSTCSSVPGATDSTYASPATTTPEGVRVVEVVTTPGGGSGIAVASPSVIALP